MNTLKELDINTIAGGVAPELFKRELEQLLTNIDDPNTDAEAVRQITLKIKFKPDPKRSVCAVSVEATSKLASVLKAMGQVYLGRHNGKLCGFAHDINQMNLNLDTTPKLVSIEKE